MVKRKDLIKGLVVDIFILDILYDELSVEEHLELVGKVFMKETDVQIIKAKNERK
jgi:hypothetical protein